MNKTYSSHLSYQGIAGLCFGVFFALVTVLEYSTPPDYVFGYLYIGAILLASSYLSCRWTRYITVIAVVLTLVNIWIPQPDLVNFVMVSNRIIAIVALVVTSWLSERIQRYERALAQQNIQIQAQEQLAKVREDFVSTLMHDLKTPLLGAITTLKAFSQNQFGPITSEQSKAIAVMSRSHQTTLKLVDTLMDVYRNDIEGISLEISQIDLMELAEATVSQLTTLALSRQVYIRLSQGASDFRQSCWVEADEFQMRRVLTNLISNAINHSFRGGKIEIMIQPKNDQYLVQVIDEGGGIAVEELPHLFERFYQGNSARQAKGTGLGLYLSRQIIEAHGGMIWAEARSSKGAIFSFLLPAHYLNQGSIKRTYV